MARKTGLESLRIEVFHATETNLVDTVAIFWDRLTAARQNEQ
jgi:hypothetical protein